MSEDTAEACGDALPVGCILGDYTIERVIGQGGFGITYLAHDAAGQRKVVIKESLPATFAVRRQDSYRVEPRGSGDSRENFRWATENFLKEAQLLASLNHPNIVPVYKAFSAIGTAFYVMPWMGGMDLAAYAHMVGGLNEGQMRGLLCNLLNAFSYLHSRNLLHRDIKPGNILCTEDGTPVLIDFGTARAMVSERSQTVVESAGYTPIEQMQSHGNTGPWTDLYALGATCHKLITGEHPPRSSDRMGKTDCYVPLAGRAELKGRYSANFLAGIDKALAVWPEDRWQSADEWLGNLMEPAAATSSTDAAPPPVPRKKQGKSQRTSPNKIRCFLLWGVPVIAFLCGIIIAKQDSGVTRPQIETTPSKETSRWQPAEQPQPQPPVAPQNQQPSAPAMGQAEYARRQALAREILNSIKQLMAILNGVNSRETADAAAPKVKELLAMVDKLRAKGESLPQPSDEIRQKLEAEFEGELQGVIDGMQGAFMSLEANQYYGSQKLKQALAPLRGAPEE